MLCTESMASHSKFLKFSQMSGENAFYTILVYVTDDAAGGLKSDFNFLEHFDTFKNSTGNDLSFNCLP